MLDSPLAPVYAILDVDITRASGHDPDAVFDAWLDAGIRLIQLRAKTLDADDFLALADGMAARASAAGATFLVNDRADVARLSGAAGVHVGQGDLGPEDARLVVGSRAIVGVSTHNLEQADVAARTTADYLAIGPVFSTSSKANPDPVVGIDGVAAVAALARAAGKPLVAIGGMTLESAPVAIAAGADAVAVLSALVAGDPAERARAFLRALSSPHVRTSS